MRQLLTKEHLNRIFADAKSPARPNESKTWAVKVNSPVQRVKIVGQFLQAAEQAKLVAREVSLAIQPTIFQQIDRELAKPPRHIDCIIINGYVSSAKDAPSEEQICQILEAFARTTQLGLSYTTVFCLPVFLLDLAYRKAPNFWRAVSTRIIDLKLESELPKELDYGFIPLVAEPPEARAKRLQLLENQLAEIRQRYKASPQDQIPIMLLLAQAYFDDRQYEKTFEVYNDLLLLLSAPEDLANRALVLHRLGTILHLWGYYEKALQHYRDSLALRSKADDIASTAELLHQIGLLYQDLGEFEKAIDYYSRSISHNRELKNSDASAGTLLNLGLVYEEIGLHIKAVEHYREAFELFRQKNNLRGMGLALLHAGEVYAERALYKEATKYYFAAKNIFERLDNPYREIVKRNLAEIERIIGKSEYEKLVQGLRPASGQKNSAASPTASS
ncbi:MAG: tetratricopeptide repeat protein [Candidatus Thermochlorobacter sp.]